MSRRTKLALAGAAAGSALLILTWWLALHVRVFEQADQSIFAGFVDLHYRHRIDRLAQFVATLCDPSPYVYLAAVPVLVSLLRGRRRSLAAIAAILLGANLTTEVLKPLLAAPRAVWTLSSLAPPPQGSWPSGHATAAMALALCCVLAAPPRLRPVAAALGAAFSVAVSYSFLALGWHLPSDVFGGFLVAGTWAMLALAALSWADARWPTRRPPRRPVRLSVREALAPQVLLVVLALAGAGLLALASPHGVLSYARGHALFVIGAAAIAALALIVAAAITLVVRR